jgi:glucose-1-phosphatase
MIKGIKHIIFDLGGVLLNIDTNLTLQALENLGIPNFKETYQKLQEQSVFDDLETGHLNTESFLKAIKSVAMVPLQDEDIINAWNILLLDFPLRRLQILQQLQLYYDLVLLSNTNEIHETAFNKILHQAHGVPNIGVFFDKVYYSHKLGMRKPNPSIFERVLSDCNFIAKNTLFIDDSAANIVAADALGIQTIWLKEGMSIEKDVFLSLNGKL